MAYDQICQVFIETFSDDFASVMDGFGLWGSVLGGLVVAVASLTLTVFALYCPNRPCFNSAFR